MNRRLVQMQLPFDVVDGCPIRCIVGYILVDSLTAAGPAEFFLEEFS